MVKVYNKLEIDSQIIADLLPSYDLSGSDALMDGACECTPSCKRGWYAWRRNAPPTSFGAASSCLKVEFEEVHCIGSKSDADELGMEKAQLAEIVTAVYEE